MESLLTCEEVAKVFRVKPNTVRIWTMKGILPCIRIGRSVRYRQGELDRWLEERSNGAKGGGNG